MSVGVGADDDGAKQGHEQGGEHEQRQDHEQDADHRRPGLWICVTTDSYACMTCGETFETAAAVDEYTREHQTRTFRATTTPIAVTVTASGFADPSSSRAAPQ